jgi:hypothetical protein
MQDPLFIGRVHLEHGSVSELLASPLSSVVNFEFTALCGICSRGRKRDRDFSDACGIADRLWLGLT